VAKAERVPQFMGEHAAKIHSAVLPIERPLKVDGVEMNIDIFDRPIFREGDDRLGGSFRFQLRRPLHRVPEDGVHVVVREDSFGLNSECEIARSAKAAA